VIDVFVKRGKNYELKPEKRGRIQVNNGQKAIDIRLYIGYNIRCMALFYLMIRRDIFEKRRKDKRGVGLSDTKFNKGKEMSYISK
jgi:hypothetical protein